MKEKYWIDLHYATRLNKTITVKTLKLIIKCITAFVLHAVITCLIFASLSSCASSKDSHWNTYTKCGAYGNP